MEQLPNVASTRVTLTKVQRATPAGADLIALLTQLSEDGIVTRDEVAELRAWLEIDRGVDFPACAFLYETVDSISSDGDITEEELDTLALAIERVLPPDVRKLAAEKRKERRAARRQAELSSRQADRTAAREQRERARPLHHGDFIVAGALRSAERRDACEQLAVAEGVLLEREPDNRHDENAILILTQAGDELGYVPREDAKAMAPLMDAGGWVDATIKKLLETREGWTLPVVVSKLYRQEFERARSQPGESKPATSPVPLAIPTKTPRSPATAPTEPPSNRRGYWLLFGTLFALLVLNLLVKGCERG
jgi:hypothetical protein